MATLAIVGIVLAVLVAGGGVAWVATGGLDDDSKPAASEASSSATADADAGEVEADQDTDDAPATGKVITCTHSVDGEKLTSYWKSSELFRFDMNTPAGAVHTIAIDRVFYTWGANLPSGIKMSAQSGADAPGMSSISPDFIENMPGNANAKCSTYTGDDSIFTLPKDVTFRSMPGQ